jgi:hypothetical protein
MKAYITNYDVSLVYVNVTCVFNNSGALAATNNRSIYRDFFKNRNLLLENIVAWDPEMSL